jgi:hypothetical protein
MTDSIVKVRELADGYAFELDGGRFSIKELATWTDFERRCCPFFDFNLEWRRENGPMTLRLTGRDGVKPFIKSEFPKNFRWTLALCGPCVNYGFAKKQSGQMS